MAAGRPLILQGKAICAADLMVARKAGLSGLAVRLPHIRVIDVTAASGETFTTHFVAESLKASCAAVAVTETGTRDAAAIAAALDEEVPVPVISAALYGRFESHDETDYADRLLSALRKQFGGHAERKG